MGGEFTVDKDPKGLIRLTVRTEGGQIQSFATDPAGAIRVSDLLRQGAGAPNPWTRREKVRAFIGAAFYVWLGMAAAIAFFAFGAAFGQEFGQ